jgi:RNA polymerase sigma-70 factor (ECF subfamily)
MLAAERESEVRRGLRQLGEMDRDTLVAFYFDGRSLVEMSEEFDSPVGTIKRRLHVARKRLAKELEALATA